MQCWSFSYLFTPPYHNFMSILPSRHDIIWHPFYKIFSYPLYSHFSVRKIVFDNFVCFQFWDLNRVNDVLFLNKFYVKCIWYYMFAMQFLILMNRYAFPSNSYSWCSNRRDIWCLVFSAATVIQNFKSNCGFNSLVL